MMKTTVRQIFLTLTLALVALAANAEKVQKKVYLYGFAISLNDSIVATTTVQEMDSMWVDKKTKFFNDREQYSYQFRDYLRENGMKSPTCVTLFAFDRKSIDKKVQKLMKRYVNDSHIVITPLTAEDFSFTAVEYEPVPELTKEELKQLKEEQKQKKAEQKQRMKERKADAKATKAAAKEAEKAEKAKK